MNLAAIPTSNLVAAYNAMTGANIKKFETRAKAEARVVKLYTETKNEAAGALLGIEPAPAPQAEFSDADVPAFLKKDRIAAIAEVVPEPVAEEKPARKAREPKAKPEAGSVTRSKVAGSAIISKVTENPKKEGSKAHARFALYREGQTVDEFIAACVEAGFPATEAKADISWDRRHGLIAVE